MANATIAYVRNLARRPIRKSVRSAGPPKMSRALMATTSATSIVLRRADIAFSMLTRPRWLDAGPKRHESRRLPAQEEDHQKQHCRLADICRTDEFKGGVHQADRERCQDSAWELSYSAQNHDHERVNDVVRTQRWPNWTKQRERTAGDSRQPSTQTKCVSVHGARRDTQTGRDIAILHDRTHTASRRGFVQIRVDGRDAQGNQ